VRTHFGYQIIKVEKVVPAEDKRLDEVRNDIALEQMKTEAGKALAQKKAEEALHAAQGGKALAEQFPSDKKDDNSFDFGAANKLQVQETGPFALEGDFVPKMGPAPELAQAAFGLTTEHPVAGKVFEQGGAFYVIELKNREKPNDADFTKGQDELRQGLLQRRENELLTAYLKELREESKVEENQALVLAGKPVAS
jgi:peptidyl-prolyl cis-trans isomerase D